MNAGEARVPLITICATKVTEAVINPAVAKWCRRRCASPDVTALSNAEF